MLPKLVYVADSPNDESKSPNRFGFKAQSRATLGATEFPRKDIPIPLAVRKVPTTQRIQRSQNNSPATEKPHHLQKNGQMRSN